MDWGQYLNSSSLLSLALPAGIGVAIIILYFLRLYLYSYMQKLAAKTKTCFDDINQRQQGSSQRQKAIDCVW